MASNIDGVGEDLAGSSSDDDRTDLLQPCLDTLKDGITIKTTKLHTCCWLSEVDDEICLGGRGILTQLKEDGHEKAYTLWDEHMEITSGLRLTRYWHLLCGQWQRVGRRLNTTKKTRGIFLVNLNNNTKSGSELQPVNALNVDIPVRAFIISLGQLGILCKRDNWLAKIECFEFKNVLNNRHPSCGNRINLDVKILDDDNICTTSEGNLCVTSMANRSVYIYTIEGDLLQIYSHDTNMKLNNRGTGPIVSDDQLHRLFVQCCWEGILVISDTGVVCTFNGDIDLRWKVKAKSKKDQLETIHDCICREGKIWCIQGYRNQVRIYIDLPRKYQQEVLTSRNVRLKIPRNRCLYHDNEGARRAHGVTEDVKACATKDNTECDVDDGGCDNSNTADDADDVYDYDNHDSQLPDPDAKVLCEKQEVFPPPYISQCPTALTFDKTITLSSDNYCCWRSDEDDQIFLGGEGVITVLRTDGRQIVYKLLNSNFTVVSGLAVTSVKQLIIVRCNLRTVRNIYTVNINTDQVDDTPVHNVNELEVEGKPVNMFNIDKLRYGVLCRQGTIKFFTLKNILLDDNPESSNDIKLDMKICENDKASGTPQGDICIASWARSTIYIYNIDGELLHEYSAEREMHALGDVWHNLFSGRDGGLFVQYCGEGTIVINKSGLVFTLNHGKLTRVCDINTGGNEPLKRIHDCVTSEGRMWFVEENTQAVHVYNTSDVPYTPIIVNNCQDKEEVILRPRNDTCPCSLVYAKTITTQNKHTCCWRSDTNDKIFLGGKNIITILREDERLQTYNLSGEETFGRPSLTVISGLAVTSNKHLICVEPTDPDVGKTVQKYLYRVDIKSDITDGSHLQLEKLYEVDNPICVFMANNLQYGVFNETKTNMEIKLFTWKEVLDCMPPTSDRLKHSDNGISCAVSNYEKVCATPAVSICVASFKRSAIFLLYGDECEYSAWKAMHTMEDAYWGLFEREGHVYNMLCPQKDCDMTIVNIQSKDDNTRLINALDHLTTEGNMWFIDKKAQAIHLYSTSALPQASASSLSGSDPEDQYFEAGVFLRLPADPCPFRMVYDKTITTQHKHNCCWRSDTGDEIFLGGQNVITALNVDGSQKTYNLNADTTFPKLNLTVISGLAVTSNKHLIWVEPTDPHAGNDALRYLWKVDIKSDLTDKQYIKIVQLSEENNPICVFMANNLQYGVVYERRPYTKIELLTWKQILGIENPLKRRHSITLEKVFSRNDAVCATPEGNICIASYASRTIYMYNTCGEPLHEYTLESVIYEEAKKWRALFIDGDRLFLHCHGNGQILLNNKGIICSFKNGYLNEENEQDLDNSSRLTNIGHCVTTEGRMWFLDENTQVVHVYNTSAPPRASSLESFEGYIESPVVCVRPSTDPCPGKLMYDTTVTTQYKHTCCWRSTQYNELYLGGTNIITTLVKDGFQGWDSFLHDTKNGIKVISGVAMTGETHLVCVEATYPFEGHAGKRRLYRFDCGCGLDDMEFDVKNPVCIFMANKFQYGVVCDAELYIEIAFISGLQTNVPLNQYIVLNHKWSMDDTACATPDGNICVSSAKEGCVHMYNMKGEELEVFVKVRIAGKIIPRPLEDLHSLRHPGLFVQCCTNGILVINADGVVFTLIDGRWRISNNKTTTRLGRIRDFVYSGGTIWVIDKNNEHEIRIYNNNY